MWGGQDESAIIREGSIKYRFGILYQQIDRAFESCSQNNLILVGLNRGNDCLDKTNFPFKAGSGLIWEKRSE